MVTAVLRMFRLGRWVGDVFGSLMHGAQRGAVSGVVRTGAPAATAFIPI